MKAIRKIIFHIASNMEGHLQGKKKTKRQLVTHGNYSSTANYRTKNSRGISKNIWNFSRHFKIFTYLFYEFLAEPAAMFCEISVGQHCSTVKKKAGCAYEVGRFPQRWCC
jgi:hypothetical protein